jgi:hypothetical protein
MRKPLKHLWTGTRWCLSCVFSFVLWSVWLALVLLLCGQVYIATHDQLEIPPMLLRSLEERLAVSGVKATFGRTSFDPTGRVLIENVRLSLPSFAEPVATVRSIYVRLDPWSLAAGHFEPSEIRVSGATLAVAGMLSPSGQPEEILRDLDATFIPHEKQVDLAHLTARVAGITLVAQGAVHLPPRDPARAGALPTADFFSRNYPALCRQLIAFSQKLTALEQPSLYLDLTPSESRGAIVDVTLFARALQLTVPQPVALTGIRATTKLPLLGEAPVAARIELTANSLKLPFNASAQNLRALVRGTLRPGRLQFDPHEVELSVGALSVSGFTAHSLAARLRPGPLPRLDAELDAVVMGSPLAVQAEVDLSAQTADLRFEGAISTNILTPLSDLIHVDVRKYFDFAFIDRARGRVRLGPAWKFQNVAGHFDLRGINAYHVIMEEGFADIEFDGRHFYASDTGARIGENFGRGTFEQDLVTLRYRFLLDGRLRPLDIGGWFRGDWWPNFFNQLEFPDAPPKANVEVSGRWTEGRQSIVFVSAQTSKAVIRGAPLDGVRTRIFIRPGFYDAMQLFATHPTGTAQGSFCYSTDDETYEWKTLELNLASTLDPSVAVKMLGPAGESIFGPFKWSAPPSLKVAGRIDGAAAPGGAHTTLAIEARTSGEFRFQDFPLENLVFTAAMRDDDLDLSQMEARFADGKLTGHARVFGTGASRRVNFDYTLKDASLGRAAATLQDFSARKKGEPPPPPGKFIQEKAYVRFDLSATAEGRYDDPFSYRGEGQALVQGAGLGEVHLLGLLSELFKFTSLRFNVATTHFKIDGAKLTFPDLSLRGANSAIDAHGDFFLDRRALDFKAKIFPFQESSGILKTVAGTILSPFSNIFEVKLTGTLDKPDWALTLSPTNLFRSSAPGETPVPAGTTPPPSGSPGPGSAATPSPAAASSPLTPTAPPPPVSAPKS